MKKSTNYITIIILIGLLIGATVCTEQAKADIFLDKSNFYHVGNITYNVTDNLYFSRLIQTNTYIQFNTTQFHTTAPNPTNITIDFINHTMFAANSNDKLLCFYTNTTGLISFQITGFLPNTKYDLYRDTIFLSTITSNTSGNLSFTNTGTHYFEIYTTRGLLPISSTIIGCANGVIISLLGGLSLCLGTTYYFIHHKRRTPS